MKKASKTGPTTSQDCRCQRSACSKNYCRCYNANRMCGASCKCLGESKTIIPKWCKQNLRIVFHRLQECPSRHQTCTCPCQSWHGYAAEGLQRWDRLFNYEGAYGQGFPIAIRGSAQFGGHWARDPCRIQQLHPRGSPACPGRNMIHLTMYYLMRINI